MTFGFSRATATNAICVEPDSDTYFAPALCKADIFDRNKSFGADRDSIFSLRPQILRFAQLRKLNKWVALRTWQGQFVYTRSLRQEQHFLVVVHGYKDSLSGTSPIQHVEPNSDTHFSRLLLLLDDILKLQGWRDPRICVEPDCDIVFVLALLSDILIELTALRMAGTAF